MWLSLNTLFNVWSPDCMALLYNHLFCSSNPVISVSKRFLVVVWILTTPCWEKRKWELRRRRHALNGKLCVILWSGKNIEKHQKHTHRGKLGKSWFVGSIAYTIWGALFKKENKTIRYKTEYLEWEKKWQVTHMFKFFYFLITVYIRHYSILVSDVQQRG